MNMDDRLTMINIVGTDIEVLSVFPDVLAVLVPLHRFPHIESILA